MNTKTTILTDSELTIGGFNRVLVCHETDGQREILDWISDKTAKCDIESHDETPAWPEMAIN